MDGSEQLNYFNRRSDIEWRSRKTHTNFYDSDSESELSDAFEQPLPLKTLASEVVKEWLFKDYFIKYLRIAHNTSRYSVKWPLLIKSYAILGMDSHQIQEEYFKLENSKSEYLNFIKSFQDTVSESFAEKIAKSLRLNELFGHLTKTFRWILKKMKIE